MVLPSRLREPRRMFKVFSGKSGNFSGHHRTNCMTRSMLKQHPQQDKFNSTLSPQPPTEKVPRIRREKFLLRIQIHVRMKLWTTHLKAFASFDKFRILSSNDFLRLIFFSLNFCLNNVFSLRKSMQMFIIFTFV